MDVPYLLAEPDVEWVLRGAQPGEGRLRVVGFDANEGEVTVGRLLDPNRLAGRMGALNATLGM